MPPSYRTAVVILLMLVGVLSAAVLRLSGTPAVSVKEASCSELRNSLERDACNYRRALSPDVIPPEFRDSPSASPTCLSIADPYLAYVCLRLTYRPHMRLMLTSDYYYKFYNQEPELLRTPLPGCAVVEPMLALPCFYSRVGLLAQENATAARSLCDALEGDRIIGECEFYVAVSIVMSLRDDYNGTRDRLLHFCEGIGYPKWKAECFYLLADELAVMDESDVKDIVMACEKSSSISPDFLCFHHLAGIGMTPERAVAFCNAVVNRTDKLDCLRGIFPEVGRPDFDRMASIISGCLNVSAEYRKYCFRGIGMRLFERMYNPVGGGSGGSDVLSAMERCRGMPLEFEYDCLYGAWVRSIEEVQEIPGCTHFPQKYLQRCLEHLVVIRESGWSRLTRPGQLLDPMDNRSAMKTFHPKFDS